MALRGQCPWAESRVRSPGHLVASPQRRSFGLERGVLDLVAGREEGISLDQDRLSVCAVSEDEVGGGDVHSRGQGPHV